MTAPEKPEVDLQAYLDAMEAEEVARIEGLTEAQLDEELRSQGVDPQRAVEIARRVVDEAHGGRAGGAGEGGAAQATATGTKGQVVSLEGAKKRRGWRVPTATVLALAAGVAGVVQLVGPQTIAAWFSPTAPQPTGTTPAIVPPTHEETPLEKARRLREEAYVDVKKQYYGEAWDRLEEAKGIDPKGDEAEEVQAAWREVQLHKPQPRGFVKPGLGPGEVPLQKHGPGLPRQP